MTDKDRIAELEAEVARLKKRRSGKRINELRRKVWRLKQENHLLREEVARADAFMAMDNCRSAG